MTYDFILKNKRFGISLLVITHLAWLSSLEQLAAQDTAATTTPGEKPKTSSAVQLDDVNVTAKVKADPLTAPTAETAEKIAEETAGGAAVIDAEERKAGAANNAADLLANQPGVQVRDAGGRTESGIISVRGAGTSNGGPYGNTSKGVSVFVNGLAVTSPGAFAFEVPDTLATGFVEVFRGASALTHGSLSLGGGINYVYKTGYNSSPFTTRFDVGSYGYHRENISSGGVYGPVDYYFSATNAEQEGYRDNSQAESQRIHFNVGYKVNENVENRFYFGYIKSNQQNPRVLTEEQMYEDPRQVSPELGTGLRGGLTRDAPGTYLLQNRTGVKLDEASSLDFNFQYLNFPSETQGTRTVPLIRSSYTHNANEKVAGTITYAREDLLFDHASKTNVSFAFDHLFDTFSTIRGDSYNPNPGVLLQDYEFGGTDLVLALSNDYDVLGDNRLWVTSAVALSKKTRDARAVFPVEDDASLDYTNIAPQLGLRYEITPNFSVFTNISKLTETAAAQRLIPATAAPYTIPDYARDLKEQEAIATEIGFKGKVGRFEGGIGYYYQTIRHEILTVSAYDSNNNPITITSNASPTIHQGIEFNLKTTLWESYSEETASDANDAATAATLSASTAQNSKLVLNTTYTWANNYFQDDENLGKNELPGLAQHYYAAELLFSHASGFYIGTNITGTLQGVPIDYKNSKDYYANPYLLVGAKAGYVAPSKKWEIYVEGRNLTDKTYASVLNPIYDAEAVSNNNASLATYWPGDGISVTTGFTYRF